MLCRVRFCLLLTVVSSALTAFAADAQWVEVRSPHFSVITDAGDKRGRQAALHFEQMRTAFGLFLNKSKVSTPVPLQIIAFRNTKEMRQFVPLWKGKPIQLAGLFQGGEDRCFILLDMSLEDPWKVVFHEYGHQLLNGNITFRAQPWFDEGFAEFFSTIQVTGNKVNVGSPSDINYMLLTQNHLLKTTDLFQVVQQSSTYNESGDRRNIFYAQSWLVVHYLYDKRLISQLGAYFDAVGQGKTTDEAIQKAFGMSAADFDKTIQKYLQANRFIYYPIPLPEGFDGSAYTVKPVQPLDVRAVFADVHLHSPDYSDAAMQEFQDILKEQPNNQAALRGLGYGYLRKMDVQQAGEYFNKAVEADSNDPRVLYYSAVLAQREIGMHSNPENLVKVQKQLEKAITLDPDFADSYSVLSFILMSEGKPDDAVPVMTKAISLNPRNEQYSLNLAQLYMMQHKYDDAVATLKPLAQDPHSPVAFAAQRLTESAQSMKQAESENRLVKFRVGTDNSAETLSVEAAASIPPAPAAPIAFMKGKLVSVDCSDPKAAELTMTLGPKTWKLHVKDRAHALVIGADVLSCSWTNQRIAVNYRKTGEASGDLVSIEVQ